ncbi:hypothetical protein HUK80_13380 [Flavobacterium sp. MAH-1]|uniref:Limonene hydroxylase n=1 Tax=Flavobacterium agri TaxID=2743471 RepID=A0A7Y9C6Y9_9FLAO|nr:hypothetical protein [Flavobacterium agri]NUY81890.1 hypothetical protein [Flavobacterium agri]NYA71914.1 hypothetical protein [Flavobacterium agri]
MIKKWFQNILDKKELIEVKEWRTDNSIFQFLSSSLDGKGSLDEKAHDLPDEKKDDGQLKFASGLMDAMFGVSDSDDSKKRIAALLKHIKRVARAGDKISEQEFYHEVAENEGVIGIIDEFLRKVVEEALPIEPYLFRYAKDLATKTDKRNAVKFGIAILGLCQDKSVLGDIKILGLHDEFTVYATIAIMNVSDNAVNDLWELAQKVDGWGKIQSVDRLAGLELGNPVKDWLLLEGYKNNIMHEYLAYTCAMNGELHTKLESAQIEYGLFRAASDILEALIVEHSPAEDITAYAFASQVIEDFIRHAKNHAASVSDFNALHKIKDFLTELQDDIGEQKGNGWTQDGISNCLIDLVEILNAKDWKAVAREALKSNDNLVYWNAKQAADKLGIDLWDTVWARLQENPLDSSSWFDVTHHGKPEHAEEIIGFALTHLPFEELGTGAKDSHGFGDDYNKHTSLECATTFLGDYPGMGEKIILTALKSPVTRNRNMAIGTLSKWKKDNWSPEIEKEVDRLSQTEPNTNTKENLQKLLKGQELE